MDIVFIEGLTIPTIIGIDPDELDYPQPVRANLAIGVKVNRACETDSISDTINYASVRDALHRLFASHGLQLLEALAEAVAQLIVSEHGAQWVRVSLAKPAKFDDVESVGVVIERRRQSPHDEDPHRALSLRSRSARSRGAMYRLR
jgi:dihydroneopterin aldolase